MLRNWLIGNMGSSGEFMYTAIHWYSLAAVGVISGLLFVLAFLWRQDPGRSRRLLKSVALFQLCFEVFWRLIYLFVKGDSLISCWPMYPCNLGGILLPLLALADAKLGKRMFYLFGFVGACLTFALPDGIFCNNVFVFPILKSVLQHTGLLLIPVLEYISGTYRPKLQDMGWITAGGILHIVNCEGIVRLLGLTGDYMFFRGTLPFVIPGVPQWITVSVFAFLVLSLLAFLSDVPGSLSHSKHTAHTP